MKHTHYSATCWGRRRKTRMRPFSVILFALLLMGVPAQTSSTLLTSPGQAVVTAVRQVSLYISVRDSIGRPIDSLKLENFTIKDDKVPRHIDFFSDQPEPASVAVLFDVSRFMAGGERRQANRLFETLRRESLPANGYLIATFGEKEEFIANWTNRESAISSAVGRIGAMKSQADAALYDALYETMQRMDSAGRRRHVIIVISNWHDMASRLQGFKEVRDLLERSDTTLYSIGSPLDLDTSGHGMHAMDQMEELCEASGGSALFASTPQEMTSPFHFLATDLPYSYTLRFSPNA